MEKFSALLPICAGNSPVPGEFPSQRPVTRTFDVYFDLRLNKRLSKQSWGWLFETLSSPLWRHSNAIINPSLAPSRLPKLGTKCVVVVVVTLKRNFVVLTKCWPLAAPKVVIFTTFGAAVYVSYKILCDSRLMHEMIAFYQMRQC